jgi:NDP-sugar pyrophosphorylase family protein
MLMTKLLICPSERKEVALLSQGTPLANAPLLGQSLIEYWLSALACAGIQKALILAADRPEEIQTQVGDGARWGLELKVIPESRELTPAQALIKYGTEFGPVPISDAISLVDHLPGLAEYPLFDSYASWFAGLRRWMPQAITPDRVGVRRLRSNVWVGTDSHVSPGARLRAPCWVGRHVFVGAGAVVGPNAVLEDGVIVEPSAEVAHSWVGPDTFVGQLGHIVDSLAWRDILINCRTGSIAQVADPFLLCALRRPRRIGANKWLARIAELYARNKEDLSMIWRHLLVRKQG